MNHARYGFRRSRGPTPLSKSFGLWLRAERYHALLNTNPCDLRQRLIIRKGWTRASRHKQGAENSRTMWRMKHGRFGKRRAARRSPGTSGASHPAARFRNWLRSRGKSPWRRCQHPSLGTSQARPGVSKPVFLGDVILARASCWIMVACRRHLRQTRCLRPHQTGTVDAATDSCRKIANRQFANNVAKIAQLPLQLP